MRRGSLECVIKWGGDRGRGIADAKNIQLSKQTPRKSLMHNIK